MNRGNRICRRSSPRSAGSRLRRRFLRLFALGTPRLGRGGAGAGPEVRRPTSTNSPRHPAARVHAAGVVAAEVAAPRCVGCRRRRAVLLGRPRRARGAAEAWPRWPPPPGRPRQAPRRSAVRFDLTHICVPCGPLPVANSNRCRPSRSERTVTTPGRIRNRLRHSTRCRWAWRCPSLHPIHASRARKCNAEAENPTAPRVRLFFVDGPRGFCERHGKSYLTRRRCGGEGGGGGLLTGRAIPSAYRWAWCRWYSRVVEVPVRIEVAAGFVAPGASEPPRLQPSWPPGGSGPAHG